MDLAIIIERGSAGGAEEGEHTYVGIAKVLYAFALASATDMYGEMPHSEALLGGEQRNPPFDEQEEMYTYLLALLDEAIVDLGQPAISDPGSHDLIFADLQPRARGAAEWPREDSDHPANRYVFVAAVSTGVCTRLHVSHVSHVYAAARRAESTSVSTMRSASRLLPRNETSEG
jgi:predicted RNA-binding protein with TRAM domain